MNYFVHNTSRSIEHRAKRYAAASHGGLLQFLDGRRIVRGRPLELSEEAFIANLDALKQAEADGQLEVRTEDGRKIDLDSGETLAAKPVPPLPIAVLDSAQNDIPSGRPMPIYPGGAVQSLPTPPTEPAPPMVEDDDDVEVEHTEPDSGAKKGGNPIGGGNKGRK